MHQGAGNRRPLLFAPAELMNEMLRPLPQPDQFDQFRGSLVDFPRGDPLQKQGKRDVLPNIHGRQKVEELKDEADLAAPELG